MRRWRQRTLLMAVAAGASTLALLTAVAPAQAQPATTASYPAWSSATRYVGAAFDTCTAPPLASLQAWSASPYRAVGVYVGGVNRTCGQPELTRAWTARPRRSDGRWCPSTRACSQRAAARPPTRRSSLPRAASEGTAAADDAAAHGKALGMLHGSAFYNDIENYSATDTAP